MLEQKELLTTAEAAALSGVSLRTLQRMLASEEIPGTRHGREWIIPKSALADIKKRSPGQHGQWKQTN